MKTKSRSITRLTILTLATIAVSACASPLSVPEPGTTGGSSLVEIAENVPAEDLAALEPGIQAAANGGLSEEEAAGLYFMREEEKLAHDLYLAMYELWGQPIFQNIATSETTHTEAVKHLLDQFGLEDPAADMPVGEFQDANLQSLYDNLLTRGSESLNQALLVGALVEEVDLQDLAERILQTDEPSIEQVYSNLTAGSENHLRAFVQQYESRSDQAYSAQAIDAGQLDLILASSPGRRMGGGIKGTPRFPVAGSIPSQGSRERSAWIGIRKGVGAPWGRS